ncbi:hypothetical protein LMG26857_06024 [Achromobacter anxifer]|uniref:TadE/TadG family type IV pilus assembly protein n=1 Tax=Achromobacter anxifer TaxID=1287737 RepID=UPI00155D130F|nr:TadE/TadG family type IV pilus assembly protein [Achromobacter anxifer]CAB5516942.1 hypothetical protein LMG26857_06024 [Achromobacter anxifer]
MSGNALHQKGQAVVEALLMLPLLVLLLCAVPWIGGLQFTAQEMEQASRKAVMASALGRPLQDLRTATNMKLWSGAESLPGVAAPRISVLQDEWFGAGLSLLSVTASTERRDRDASAWLRIARRTHVASGAGYAHGDADIQRRIGRAPTSWRNAEGASLSQARRMKPVIDRMDGAWGRPGLSLDWLSAWADVVPADRLAGRLRAGK